MSDMKLTNEKMLTFDCDEKVGFFKAGERLADFGERQNEANEALALNVVDLIKRVCLLEDKQVQNEDIMRSIATELSAFKKELDRLRLSDKLNTSSIARLDKAINLASSSGGENEE